MHIFQTDDFDVDIVYGTPSPDTYGASMHQNLIVLPLGTEIVTPLCAPALASEHPHAPRSDAAIPHRERDEKGDVAGLVRRQQAYRAGAQGPPFRPQFSLLERGRRRAWASRWNPCASQSARLHRVALSDHSRTHAKT